MLAWLGMKKANSAGRPFFAGVEKSMVFLILLISLAILNGVRWVLKFLIPTSFFNDPIVSMLPGVVGVLSAIVFVFLVERLISDESSPSE
ncbi:hypothetical protein RIF24_07065 [Exiguobacterium acetylicum]|uniref:hypothetical protein n=1 Tax=Exiguobacterium acetylicum TaxID=41170 RepID=UPI003977E098